MCYNTYLLFRNPFNYISASSYETTTKLHTMFWRTIRTIHCSVQPSAPSIIQHYCLAKMFCSGPGSGVIAVRHL